MERPPRKTRETLAIIVGICIAAFLAYLFVPQTVLVFGLKN